MKIFICKRGTTYWEGALIIVAETVERARELFIGREDYEPTNIEEVDFKEGVIYDDVLR